MLTNFFSFFVKKRNVRNGLLIGAGSLGILLFQNFTTVTTNLESQDIMQLDPAIYEALRTADNQMMNESIDACPMRSIDAEFDNLDAKNKLLKGQIGILSPTVLPGVFTTIKKLDAKLVELNYIKAVTARLNYAILDLTTTVPVNSLDLSPQAPITVKISGPVLPVGASMPPPVEIGLLIIDNTPFPRGPIQINFVDSADPSLPRVVIKNTFISLRAPYSVTPAGPLWGGDLSIINQQTAFQTAISTLPLGIAIFNPIAGQRRSYLSGQRCRPAILKSVVPISAGKSITFSATTASVVNIEPRYLCEAKFPEGVFQASMTSLPACQQYVQRVAAVFKSSSDSGFQTPPVTILASYQGVSIPIYPQIACTLTESGLPLGGTQPAPRLFASNDTNGCLNFFGIMPPLPLVAEKLTFGAATLLLKNTCTLFDSTGAVLSRSGLTTESGCRAFDDSYTLPTYFSPANQRADKVFFGFMRIR